MTEARKRWRHLNEMGHLANRIDYLSAKLAMTNREDVREEIGELARKLAKLERTKEEP